MQWRSSGEAHVLESPGCRLAFARGVEGVRVGNGRVEPRHLGRVGSPGHVGEQRGPIDVHLFVEGGALVGGQLLPGLDCLVPCRTLGGVVAPFDVGQGGLVGGDHAGACPRLDGHVADGHPSFHREAPDGRAPVLDDVPHPPAGADAPDDGEHEVLGRDPGWKLPVDGDRHGRRSALGEGLGGQDVLDLTGADAEGEGPEGAVGRRVAVAAHDGHARLGQPLLGTDDVDDALVGVAHRVAGNAELGAVVRQHLELLGRDGVGHRLVDVGGGHVVVSGGDGEVGPMDGPTGEAEPVECLGGGHLVDQVQVDEENVRLVVANVDHVAVPNLLGQGAGCFGHADQFPTFTISTFSLPPGAAYSTTSLAARPSRAWPRGEPGETTVRSPWRSSIDPTKKSWVSSSSSPS